MQCLVKDGVAGQRQEGVPLAVGIRQRAGEVVRFCKLVAQSLRSLPAPHGHVGKELTVDQPLQTRGSGAGAPIARLLSLVAGDD